MRCWSLSWEKALFLKDVVSVQKYRWQQRILKFVVRSRKFREKYTQQPILKWTIALSTYLVTFYIHQSETSLRRAKESSRSERNWSLTFRLYYQLLLSSYVGYGQLKFTYTGVSQKRDKKWLRIKKIFSYIYNFHYQMIIFFNSGEIYR